MPFCTRGGEYDMFEADPWDIDKFTQDCKKDYNVKPAVDAIKKQYGGKNLKAVSNIIFR